MITRILLAGAAAALLAAPPAAARIGEQVDTMNAALAGTLAICTGVIDRKFNLNDTAALAEFGFSPGSAADEAYVRQNNPGAEVAIAVATDGRVLMIGTPGKLCILEVQGPERSAVRDEVIRQLFETGARNDQHRNEDGELIRTFHFEGYRVEVQSGANGSLNIAVQPADS